MFNTMDPIIRTDRAYTTIDTRTYDAIRSKEVVERYWHNEKKKPKYDDIIISIMEEHVDLIDTISELDVLEELWLVPSSKPRKMACHPIQLCVKDDHKLTILNEMVRRINKRDIFPHRKRIKILSAFIRLILRQVLFPKEEEECPSTI